MTKGFRIILLLLALPAFQISCRFEPMYSRPRASHNMDAKAKEFATLPDKSIFYLYRLDQGNSLLASVSIDGQKPSDLVAQSYIRLEETPGVHDIVATSEMKISKFSIYSEPGKLYFICCVWGTTSNPLGLPFLSFRDPRKLRIQLHSEDDGRDEVRQIRLLEPNKNAVKY